MIKNGIAWAFIALASLVLASCANGTVSPQVSTVVADGQLFCAEATATGPLVVALANSLGAPVIVTNKAASDVAAACAVIGAIPVSPPVNPTGAPVVAAKVPAAMGGVTTP